MEELYASRKPFKSVQTPSLCFYALLSSFLYASLCAPAVLPLSMLPFLRSFRCSILVYTSSVSLYLLLCSLSPQPLTSLPFLFQGTS
jgi:hypothetical protein